MTSNTSEVEAVALAQRFHETYERLAPSFGYKTREASAKPWAEVPENNRQLMTAVCAEIIAAMQSQPDVDGLVERLRERNRQEASRRNSAYDRFGMDNTPENVDPDVWQAATALLTLSSEIERKDEALREACDLLAERKYGSPARSPGHNARLVMEQALSPRLSSGG